MEGNPSRGVSDITWDSAPTPAGLLDLFEGRFILQVATQRARAEFKNAGQLSQETILQWHTRLRECFSHAFLNHAVQDDQQLIEMFVEGILDATTCHYTLE